MKLKIAAAAACAIALAAPLSVSAVDDASFDQMLGTLEGRDTGSMWFDYYVETVNQELAYKEGTEAYGAAGPNGPLDSFNGYVAGFLMPDSGSRRFNDYVDAVNHVIQDKQAYEY